MAEIKFHKADALPSPVNSTHDGVWLIADGANNYKHFIITGGVVKELTVTLVPPTPNLTQVLTVGNSTSEDILTTGIVQASAIYTNYIQTTGAGYIEHDGDILMIYDGYGVSIASNGFLSLSAPDLELNNLKFPTTDGSTGQVLTTNGSGALSWTTVSSGGGGGSVDYSNLTNQKHTKYDSTEEKLVDSNVKDTNQGIEVDGRTKTKIVIESSITASVTTTHAFNLNDLPADQVLTMTGNTMFSFTNMISDSESVVFSFILSGAFAPSWASGATKTANSDDYNPSGTNRVVVHISRGGGTPIIYYSYENLD